MHTTELLESLQRRYAVKHFDSTKKISEEQLEVLLESLRLSPSSFGLQGWWFVVVENDALRQQLLPYSRNQKQIVEASHLLVLCRRTDVDTDFVEHYIQYMATTRVIDSSVLDGYKAMMLSFLEGKSSEDLDIRLSKQVYIAQWFLLSACALLGIDACPMEGFDSKKYNEILWLDALRLASCVVVPVGYRAADDPYATMKKVRFSKEEVVFRI